MGSRQTWEIQCLHCVIVRDRRTNILLGLVLKNGAGPIAFAALYGLVSGGLVPLGPACVAQTTMDIGHLGLRIGVMMALCSPGALTANPIGGVLRETSLGRWAVHIFAGSAVLFGAVSILCARILLTTKWRAMV